MFELQTADLGHRPGAALNLLLQGLSALGLPVALQ